MEACMWTILDYELSTKIPHHARFVLGWSDYKIVSCLVGRAQIGAVWSDGAYQGPSMRREAILFV